MWVTLTHVTGRWRDLIDRCQMTSGGGVCIVTTHIHHCHIMMMLVIPRVRLENYVWVYKQAFSALLWCEKSGTVTTVNTYESKTNYNAETKKRLSELINNMSGNGLFYIV